MIDIALVDPKFPHNVGAAVRAGGAWGATHVWLHNAERMAESVAELPRLPREERMRSSAELIWGSPFSDSLTPVAVEFRKGEDLRSFEHPEHALYVFGPEDGSLPGSVLARCHRFVHIPSIHCLNLAAAINVVLYDRASKDWPR